MPARLFFGTVHFPENEEFLEFQYQLQMVLIATGVLFTLAFIAADGLQINAMNNPICAASGGSPSLQRH